MFSCKSEPKKSIVQWFSYPNELNLRIFVLSKEQLQKTCANAKSDMGDPVNKKEVLACSTKTGRTIFLREDRVDVIFHELCHIDGLHSEICHLYEIK